MQTAKYFLCSERVGFRWWAPNDLELAKNLWGDPAVTRLFSKAPLSDSQVQDRLNAEIERGKAYNMQYWPMFELATDLHVGCGGLRPYRIEDNVYELGFHLRPEFWGKRIASEAGALVINYAFNELCATALFAGHHPENTSSRQVLLKLGFTETGTVYYEPTELFHPSYMLRVPLSKAAR